VTALADLLDGPNTSTAEYLEAKSERLVTKMMVEYMMTSEPPLIALLACQIRQYNYRAAEKLRLDQPFNYRPARAALKDTPADFNFDLYYRL